MECQTVSFPFSLRLYPFFFILLFLHFVQKHKSAPYFPYHKGIESIRSFYTFFLLNRLKQTMDDDATLVETSSSRVFGIGAGLFTIIFFACFCLLLCYIGSNTKYPGFFLILPFSFSFSPFKNCFQQLD